MTTLADYTGAGDRAGRLMAVFDHIEATGLRPVWISLQPPERALELLASAEAKHAAGQRMPLLGVPFAVKDNIDVAGLPTTAACPDFTYHPDVSAGAVERLVAAGAIPVGKTNLDQFATGLNGTRSPYGIPTCVFDPARVSGGSSSGSAIAVAAGLVPFALGTDTAGSGRVPAAFNNLVGLKPTKGLISTRGIVPACRSLDCVSVFANTVADALLVTGLAAGFDPADPFSRPAPASALRSGPVAPGFRFGMPAAEALAVCPPESLRVFEEAAARLEELGGVRTPFDFAPFQAAAELLYAGPWLAERLAAIHAFAAERPGSLHPVVRDVIVPAAQYTAVDAFTGQYRLAALRRQADEEWASMDVMLLPTAPFLPTVEAMLADPIGLNAVLGSYTNFVNLLDLSALAVPAGFTADGLPFGVTLIGPAFADGMLAALGDRLHRAVTGDMTDLAVVGAHLSNQPLNGQLTSRGGRLLRTVRTAAGYSLYALPGTVPPKPGLVRDGGAGGIELEVWRLPTARYGELVAGVPAPLCIGTIELDDGAAVQGFLCETQGAQGAEDITAFAGWRAYLAATSCSGRV